MRLPFFFVIVNKMLKLNKEIGDYSQVKDALTFNHQGVLLATYNNSINKLIVSEFNYILFNIMHKIKLFICRKDVDVKRKLDVWLLLIWSKLYPTSINFVATQMNKHKWKDFLEIYMQVTRDRAHESKTIKLSIHYQTLMGPHSNVKNKHNINGYKNGYS
jgi:hypothetical protein